jgi:hypothetical protein
MQEELPASNRVRAVFEEVLAGDEFQYAEASPWSRWLQAFTDFIGDLLRRWWPDLQEADVQLISWVALAILSVTSFLLIYRWASASQRGSRRVDRAADPAAEPLDAGGWARRARAAAAAGRYREAATGLYQSTILQMDADGRLRYRDWKTPGDYAREISGEASMRTGFVAFLTSFVEVAFGPAEPDASTFDALAVRAASFGGRV